MSDLCQALNLSGLANTVCKTLENQPLTANFIYTMYKLIEPKIPELFDGVPTILRSGIESLLIQELIFPQLPWLIFFFIIMFILWWKNVVPFYGFIGLTSFAVILVILILALYSFTWYHTVEMISNNTKNKIISNFNNIKHSLFASDALGKVAKTN